MKDYFKVNVSKYVSDRYFDIVRPASLNYPKNNSVMFITKQNISKAFVFEEVENCLIFWPSLVSIPENIKNKHAIVCCDQPHTEYCRFFKDNDITNIPIKEELDYIDGAWIGKKARIGKNCVIMPGAYISSGTQIGDNTYIGAGTKIVGDVLIGNNVIIRENAVLGNDSLTTDRDYDSTGIAMPQYGRVVIEDDVQIGANTVISRGAIDDTLIRKGTKISGLCYISHNVVIDKNVFIAGETMLLGSSSVGKNCLISGNVTINNAIHIGDDTIIGMGAIVTKEIPSNVVAFGSPAKVMKIKGKE